MKISPKIKAGCGVVTVFGLGFLAGAFSLLVLISKVVPLAENWKTEKSKQFIVEHFANQLKLDESQRAEFEPIVREGLERRWELRREYVLKDQEMVETEVIPRIAEILNEKQKEKAKRMMERWRKDVRFKISETKPESLRESAEEIEALQESVPDDES